MTNKTRVIYDNYGITNTYDCFDDISMCCIDVKTCLLVKIYKRNEHKTCPLIRVRQYDMSMLRNASDN